MTETTKEMEEKFKESKTINFKSKSFSGQAIINKNILNRIKNNFIDIF